MYFDQVGKNRVFVFEYLSKDLQSRPQYQNIIFIDATNISVVFFTGRITVGNRWSGVNM